MERVYSKVLSHIFVLSLLIFVFLGRYLAYPKSFIEKNTTSLTGEIVSINYQKNSFKLKINSEKVIVYSKDIKDLELGMVVEVNGKINAIKDVSISRLFSFKKYYASQKIYYSINTEDIVILKNNNSFINYLKNQLIRYINSFKVKDYLFLLLGDSSNLSENYQILGISHLLSISGMHFYLLLAIFSKVVKNKVLKNIFMLFLVFFFEFKVSILKSYIYYLLIKFLPKILSHVYTIIILLIINPFYIYQSGFVYSVVVSFFISILKKKSIVNILVIAFLSSLPLNFYYSYSFSLFSIIYNFIFTPLINFILFPSLLITFIFPFMDTFCSFIILVLEELVKLSLDFNVIVYMFKPSLYVVALYYIVLLACYYKRIFIIIYLVIFSCHFIYPNFIKDFVMFFDVGQGDSSLIHVDNKLVLIDTGGYYNSNNVEKEIIPFIHSLGFYKINYLVLTHSDYDHMGESINLVENFKVEKVILNCGEFDELEWELIQVLDKKKISYYSCIKELNIYNNKLYFLNNKDYGNENDNSSVIYTELNNYKFLFMGDAGVDVEQDLIKKYNLQDIDVLKVGHHGSKTSSGKEFIEEVNPKYSIISVGKNNRYGHPNGSVLGNLNGSKIYSTDQDGSIIFKIKNNQLEIETCLP